MLFFDLQSAHKHRLGCRGLHERLRHRERRMAINPPAIFVIRTDFPSQDSERCTAIRHQQHRVATVNLQQVWVGWKAEPPLWSGPVRASHQPNQNLLEGAHHSQFCPPEFGRSDAARQAGLGFEQATSRSAHEQGVGVHSYLQAERRRLGARERNPFHHSSPLRSHRGTCRCRASIWSRR